MAQNLRDRGYGSSVENYLQQQKKKQTQKGPVSQKKEVYGPPAPSANQQKYHSRQTTAAQGTATVQKGNRVSGRSVGTIGTGKQSAPAPVSTQRISTVRYDRAAPASAGKLSEAEFSRSPAMQKSYGNYDNYTRGVRVTGGGYYSPPAQTDPNVILSQQKRQGALMGAIQYQSGVVERAYDKVLKAYGGEAAFNRQYDMVRRMESNLKYLEHQAKTGAISSEAYDAAYNRYTQEFTKAMQMYDAEDQNYAKKAEKAAAVAEYAKASDAFDSMKSDYYRFGSELGAQMMSEKQAYDEWRGKIRDAKDIQPEIDSLKKEREAVYKQLSGYEALQRQMNADLTSGSAQNQATAQMLEDRMNLAEEIKRLQAKYNNIDEQLKLTEEELSYSRYFFWQGMADMKVRGEVNRGTRSPKNSLIDKVIRGEATPDEQQQAIQDFNFSAPNAAMMTDAERKKYEQILSKHGSAVAMEYYNELEKTSLNTRRRMDEEKWIRDVMDKSPDAWAAMNILSVLTKPMEVFSFVGQTADMIFSGEMEKDASYNAFTYLNNAVRNKSTEDIQRTWGQWGAFGYQTGMSMLDFLYNTAITGGFGSAAGPAKKIAENLGLLLMGSEAAADATMQAKERGLSDNQAYLLGVISGAAEIATEKISLDTLLAKIPEGKGWKGYVQYLAKNVAAEASEEGASDMINLVADILITKDQSEWAQAVMEYERQGMTPEEAFRQALVDQAEQTGMSMLGGALSGGGMALGSMAINFAKNTRALTERGSVDRLIRQGMALGENSEAYKTAEALQAKLDTEGKIDLVTALRANRTISDATITDQKSVREMIRQAEQYKGTKAEALATDLRAKLKTGQDATVREARNLSDALAKEIAVDPNAEHIRYAIRQGKASDPGSEAYRIASEIKEKIGAGKKLTVREVERLTQTVSGQVEQDLTDRSAEAIGRRLVTEDGRQVLTEASATVAAYGTAEMQTRAAEIREQMRTGEIDARTAGEVFLESERIWNRQQERAANTRVLQPREVTEEMTELERTAAQIGVSEQETARVKAVADLLSADVRYFSEEAERFQRDGRNLIRTKNGYYDKATGTIWLNAQSTNPVMTVLSHELTHSLEVTESYGEFRKLVLSMSGEMRRTIEQTYESQNLDPEDIDHEVVARYVEEHLLTDEAAIRDAVQRNRSFGQWMRDQLDKVLAKLGNEDARERVTLQKARDLYAQALKEKAASRGETDGRLRLPKAEESEAQYSISELPDGRKFVDVDVDQHLFDGLSLSEMRTTARDIIRDRFMGKTIGGDFNVFVNGESAKHYAYPENRRIGKAVLEDKLRASTELDSIMETSTFRGNEPAEAGHPNAVGGSDKFDALFRVGGRLYSAEITTLVTRHGRLFHDMTKFEDITERPYGPTPEGDAVTRDDVSKKSIAQQEPEVKGLSLPRADTQLSMTEEEAEPRGLTLPQVQNDSGTQITKEDVDALRKIGRKNISELNSEELKTVEKWAKRFQIELKEKSPFFRAWFGDWRANETTSVQVVSADTAATANSGREQNIDTGRTMSWNKDVVKESTLNTAKANKEDVRILGANIRSIVKNAVLFDTAVSEKDSKRKMPGTAFIHSFYALADIDDRTVLVKMYAEEALAEKTNEAFTRAYSLKYVQKVADIDNGVHSKGGLTGSPSATKYSVADLYALVKQYDRDFKSLPSSKIVNADGTPKVMYRGDMADFTVFDRKKARGSNLYGRGFYFTDSESHAKQYGKVRAFYLDVKQPLSPGQNEITREQMRAFLEAVAENEDDYDLQNYGYGATVDSVLDQVYGKGDFEMLQDVSATAVGDMVAAIELFNEVNGTKYDGIITGTETVTFQSTQNKSATDNIGTYDRRNPDIEHSFTEEEEGPRGLQLPKVEDEAGGRMRASAPTESEVDAAAEEQTEKKAKKPVAESRPIEARRWLNRQTIDKFGIPEGKRKAAAETVQRYADKMIDRGEVTEQDVAELFNELLYEGVVDVMPDDYSRTMREIVTGGKIHASASVKADFGDDWNAFRKRAFAAGLMLTNTSPTESGKVMGIDMIWHELSELSPGLFPADEYDPRAQLEKIVQAAEQGMQQQMTLPEYLAHMNKTEGLDMYETADRMMAELAQDFKTFGEMAKLEVKLRDRTGTKIAQERERFGEIRDKEFRKAEKIRKEERARFRETQQRARERRQISELQQKTLKQLQWLSKNRLRAPEELRGTWDELLGNLDIYAVHAADETHYSKKHEATYRDIISMYKEARANDPNFLPSKELERIMSRVDGEHLEDLDVDALRNLYQAITGLRTEFYNRNNAIMENETAALSDIFDETRAQMQAQRGYRDGFVSRILNEESLTPMNVLRRMVGWNRNSAWVQMARQLEQGEKIRRDYKVRAERLLEDFLNENKDWFTRADGIGKNAIWYEVQIPEFMEFGKGNKPIWGDTVTVWMTPLQKVHMYLESKSYDNLRHMLGGRTFADKALYEKGERARAFAAGTTVKLAPETVRSLVKDLSPEEMKLAKLLENYYNVWSKGRINEVSNKLYGYDKAMNANYAPILTNQNYVGKELGVGDATAAGVGNLKARIYSKNPSYNVSAIEAFERSVDQTGKFVGYAIAESNWQKLLNWQVRGDSMRDVITHTWDKQSLDYIENLIETLQGNRRRDGKLVLGESTNKLLSNYISAVFGANPGIVLKQAASFPQFAAVLGWTTAPNLKQLAKVDTKLINTYTSELAYRQMGYATPETAQLKNNPGLLQRNKALNFLFGGGAITAMDAATVKRGWAWAENYVRKNFPALEVGTKEQIEAGESEFYKKVAEAFEDAVSTTQPMYDEMHRPYIMKEANGIARAFTMFKTVPLQQYNTLRRMWGEYDAARKAYSADQSAENREALRKAAWGAANSVTATVGSVLGLELVELLNALWKNRGKKYRDDDDELTAQSIGTQAAIQAAEDLMGMVPAGKELAQFLENLFMGKKWYGIEIPGGEQLNDFVDLIGDTYKQTTAFVTGLADIVRNGEDWKLYMRRHAGEYAAAVKTLIEKTGMYFGGLPLENLEKYIMGGVQFSPELSQAMENAFGYTDRSKLTGKTGAQLEKGVTYLFGLRGMQISGETAAAIGTLFENGNRDAVPQDTPDSLTIDGESVKLTESQKQRWERTWSQTGREVDALVESDAFKNADDETKTKMLNKLYELARIEANKTVPGWETDSKLPENVKTITDGGGTVADAAAWYGMTGRQGIKDAEKMQILADMDVSEQIKEAIFRAEKGDRTASDDGTLTAYGKLKAAQEAGLSVTQYTGFIAELGDSGVSDPDTYRVLAKQKLSDDQKAALFGTLGTPDEDGTQRQERMAFVRSAGMKVDDYLKWCETECAQSNKSDKLRALADADMSDRDRKIILSSLFSNRDTYQRDGQKTDYAKMQELINAGMPVEDYCTVAADEALTEYVNAVNGGVPREYCVEAARVAREVKDRTNEQRYAQGEPTGDWVDYCVEALQLPDRNQKKMAVAALMNPSDWEKCQACIEHVTPNYYIQAQYLWKQLQQAYMDAHPGEKKPSMNQEYAKMVVDRIDCSQEQKAYLFNMFNKSWKKNPYGNYGSYAALNPAADDEPKGLTLPYIEN